MMVAKEVSEKMIRTHSFFVLVVCILFGVLSLLRRSFFMGFCTIGMGVVIPFVSLILMRNASKIARGTFLTQSVTIVIVVLSAAQGELHGMFALLAGNIAIGSIYYDLRNIQITWALTDVILIGAFFFRDLFYVGVSTSIIIKGILGLNIAAVMVRVLLKDCIFSINQAVEAAQRADALLEEVRVQMEATQRLMDQQDVTARHVADTAKNLDQSSVRMLNISNQMNSAAEEQAATFADIHLSIEKFAGQTDACGTAAELACDTAVQSVDMLSESNENMQQLIRAMDQLSDTSAQIGSIIKTIDDISFQTNILALNAAVEAARAGTAGKGFAVVADEVRNLASKSAQAAKDTATLITASIQAVAHGTRLAHSATSHMDEILKFSRQSEAHAKEIVRLTHEQQEDVHQIRIRVSEANEIISANTQTATESAEMARMLSDEVERMNEIIAESRSDR